MRQDDSSREVATDQAGLAPPGDEADGERPDQGASGETTRDEWIAFHVGRAPKITAKQWAATLAILRNPDRAEAS